MNAGAATTGTLPRQRITILASALPTRDDNVMISLHAARDLALVNNRRDRPGGLLCASGDNTYGRLRGHNQFEFDVRIATDRAVSRLKRAIHTISVRSHGIAPRVHQIAACPIEQPNPAAAARYALVQRIGDVNAVDVQTHVRQPHVSHGLGTGHVAL